MALYRFMDGHGDLIEIDESLIPGIGLGITVRTTHHGPSLPLEEVPRLISALVKALHVFPVQERQHGDNDQTD